MAAEYVFKVTERPPVPGSPFSPTHPIGRRWAYGVIAVLIGVTSGLGNAYIQVNLNFVQGALALYSDEGNWLTAAYLMTYVSANLLLIRFRQQFGIGRFTAVTLVVYAAATSTHLLVHDFWTAILVRGASGFASVGLATLAIYYAMQAMSPKWKLGGIMLGVSLPQLGVPLARVISPYLLDWDDWQIGYWLELGLTLSMLAAIWAVPLPPSALSKAFQRRDIIAIPLLASGLWLLVAVFAQARTYWWTDETWLGWALAASVLLIGAGLAFEHGRTRPLIDTHFLNTRQLLRLVFIAALLRFLIAEQTYEVVGFLGLFGLINDQTVTLNLVILLASIAGMVVSIYTLNPADTIRAFILSALLIAIGAGMDAFNTNLSRPSDFYVSQALIAFGALYWIGPSMVTGLSRVINAGSEGLTGWLVMFNLSQSVGGLISNTVLGTFQTVREKFHSHQLVEAVTLTNPVVAARVGGTAQAFGDTIGDPALSAVRSGVSLAQAATREANILAFNDVFLLISVLAGAGFLWGVFARASIARRHEPLPIVVFLERIKAIAAGAQGGAKP